MTPADLLTIAAGALVGAVLGLIGGGGSVLAVPLLVYGVGVPSTHVAIGTSAIAVSISAIANLLSHARAGNVKWPCAAVLSIAGVAGAFGGASVAKLVDGHRLLLMFGLLMIVVGATMLRRREKTGHADVALTAANAGRMLPSLSVMGLGVGLMAGFFGIGGGFLIVPGLMAATGMPIFAAIGTSLVSVAAFGATTAASYAVSGLIDWRVAALFIAGALMGGLAGVGLGRRLATQRDALQILFGVAVVLVGVYVCARSLMT